MMSPDEAMMPPSTTISGSNIVDQVGNRHADVFRGVAHDRNRNAVAGARALQDVGRGDFREVALDLIGHARFDRPT